MKLANLSICLVLVAVFSGCFNGTKSPETAKLEQNLSNLQLQVIDDDELFNAKGTISPKIIKHSAKPIVLIGSFDEQSIKSIEKGFNVNLKDKNFKERVSGIALVDEISGDIKRFIPSDFPNKIERPALKPIPYCAEFPEKCFRLRCKVGK
ncbi:MAG: hypothetical protein IJR18_02910, partial [Campylobacter sp.]|nr:hypothetical protein [Campylobacter sp.]